MEKTGTPNPPGGSRVAAGWQPGGSPSAAGWQRASAGWQPGGSRVAAGRSRVGSRVAPGCARGSAGCSRVGSRVAVGPTGGSRVETVKLLHFLSPYKQKMKGVSDVSVFINVAIIHFSPVTFHRLGAQQ